MSEIRLNCQFNSFYEGIHFKSSLNHLSFGADASGGFFLLVNKPQSCEGQDSNRQSSDYMALPSTTEPQAAAEGLQLRNQSLISLLELTIDRLLSGHPPGGHGDGRGLFNPPIPPQQRVGPRTWRFAAWCGATGMNTSTTY